MVFVVLDIGKLTKTLFLSDGNSKVLILVVWERYVHE
jgi:hypothetical protein